MNALETYPTTGFWEESISLMAQKDPSADGKVMNGGTSGLMLRSPWSNIKKRGTLKHDDHCLSGRL